MAQRSHLTAVAATGWLPPASHFQGISEGSGTYLATMFRRPIRADYDPRLLDGQTKQLCKFGWAIRIAPVLN
ncbi:hypothetical protein MPLSOD_280061 [Mesorhizobium sp. SOD10]|nr:hypothetical protein MPLSOD_280061 [Mesorhizobium sp. SOD10]